MFLHRGGCMHQKSQGDTQFFFRVLKLALCGLVIFKKCRHLLVNTYLLIYPKMLNMELNMTLILLMETLDIPEIYSRFDEYPTI